VGEAREPDRRHREPDRAHQALQVLDQGSPAARQPRAPRRLETQLFRFCQLDLGFALGPSDGRYLARGETERLDVVVLKTLGAPLRTLMPRRRRGRALPPGQDEPEPVSIARATVVPALPFEDEESAREWLERCRRSEEEREAAVGAALLVLNEAVRAYRLAAGDPYVHEVSRFGALVVRLGYGPGESVADGRWREAYELPEPGRRASRRRMLAPQEQFAAMLSGRRPAQASEDLLLRARLDFDLGRRDQASLQLAAAIQGLAAELDGESADVEALRSGERPLEQALLEAERIVRRRRHREL
jgi:hypothetical protein